MPHPQDVAVPSLPEPYDGLIPCGDDLGKGILDGFTADQMRAYARAAIIADRAAGRASAEPEGWRSALKFYADRCHFMLSNEDAWDTVSGEPGNFWCDEEGTATVEDGTVAARALAGDPLPDEDEDTAPTPTASIAKCDPTQTECARCKNVIANCDGVFAAPKAEGEAVEWQRRPNDVPNLPWERVSKEWATSETFEEDREYWEVRSLYTTPQVETLAVAQAAAGATDHLQLLSWIGTAREALNDAADEPIKVRRELTTTAMRSLDKVVAALSPRPEADADRASGGGV